MIKINQHPFQPKDIITTDLYKGSIIEKAYESDVLSITPQRLKEQLDINLEKGLIEPALHYAAMLQLDSLVKGGEGSRGGKVIGHTKGGKPIYEGKTKSGKDYDLRHDVHNEKHKDHYDSFTSEDHKDIAGAHRGFIKENSGKMGGDVSGYHSGAAAYHEGKAKKEASDSHRDNSAQGIADQHRKRIEAQNAKMPDAIRNVMNKSEEDADLKKAYDILGIKYTETEDSIEKASKGEGSKGGHVIGHTKSGKAVYADKNASDKSYKDFDVEDHTDAESLHKKMYEKHVNKHFLTEHEAPNASLVHANLRDHYYNKSIEHQKERFKKIEGDNAPLLSKEEKGVLADQTKKKVDHHNEMIKHHETMFTHAANEQKKHKAGSSQHSAYQAEQEKHLADSQRHKEEKMKLW